MTHHQISAKVREYFEVGARLEAVVVGIDEKADVAVLKVEPGRNRLVGLRARDEKK